MHWIVSGLFCVLCCCEFVSVKLCDFGISSWLPGKTCLGNIYSVCRLIRNVLLIHLLSSYVLLTVCHWQPERIDPPDPRRPDYDIRADVWSLGLSLVSAVALCYSCFSVAWHNTRNWRPKWMLHLPCISAQACKIAGWKGPPHLH